MEGYRDSLVGPLLSFCPMSLKRSRRGAKKMQHSNQVLRPNREAQLRREQMDDLRKVLERELEERLLAPEEDDFAILLARQAEVEQRERQPA